MKSLGVFELNTAFTVKFQTLIICEAFYGFKIIVDLNRFEVFDIELIVFNDFVNSSTFGVITLLAVAR